MPEYVCKICARPFSNSQSLNSHVRHCRLAQEGKTWLDVASPSARMAISQNDAARRKTRPPCAVCGKTVNTLVAKFCSSKCSRSAQKPHPPRSLESRQKTANALRKNHLRACVICSAMYTPKTKKQICCSRKCGAIQSGKKQKGRTQHWKSGGYRKGSGRSKSGWYKGFYCNSTYELVFLIFHLEHGIPIQRCDLILDYEFQGRKREYHPDFIVEGRICEVKGYWTEQSKVKSDQHPEVRVVRKEEIDNMKKECSAKGKDVTSLVKMYDRSNVKMTQCAACGNEFCKPRKDSKYCCRKCREDIQFKKKALSQLTLNSG